MDLVTTIPVNTTPAATVQAQPSPSVHTEAVPPAPVKIEEKQDTVELTQTKDTAKPPSIGRMRLMFSRLTNEQIKAVNESKMLPSNAKFQFGGKVICNNWFGISGGTQKLLPGYELKNNIFGFTKVVPEGTKGFWFKKTPEEKAEKA